jgi:hypothetical protein
VRLKGEVGKSGREREAKANGKGREGTDSRLAKPEYKGGNVFDQSCSFLILT